MKTTNTLSLKNNGKSLSTIRVLVDGSTISLRPDETFSEHVLKFKKDWKLVVEAIPGLEYYFGEEKVLETKSESKKVEKVLETKSESKKVEKESRLTRKEKK